MVSGSTAHFTGSGSNPHIRSRAVRNNDTTYSYVEISKGGHSVTLYFDTISDVDRLASELESLAREFRSVAESEKEENA